MSRPILTLTGNLLAERTLEFGDWQVGRTQRAARESFHTRGKGVNVTNMLARLGTPSTALIFAGGAAGAESEAWLRARGLDHVAFATTTPTRTGTVIWSDRQPETTFLGPDAAPDAAAVSACAHWLERQPDGGALALCGSFPGWADATFDPLRAALAAWSRRGRLFADVYGPPLAWVVDQPVELLKINRGEFAGIAGGRAQAGDLAAALAELRARHAAKDWVVSDGAERVWVASSGQPPHTLTPPRIAEVSPTGSGDVMFACILHALVARGAALADAVAFSLPYAAANAAHPGVADFPLPG